MKLRSLLLTLATALSLLAQAPLTRLVQSIPSETDLADSDVPFAKDVWVAMLRGARTSVDAAEFYITHEPGRALEPVLVELEKAAARGVKIRFLLSSRMLDQDKAALARLKAIPGAEVRSFDLATVSKGILHAKYFIVDGHEAALGSQNFDWRSLEQIHELGVQTTDPRLVAPLLRLFNLDWAFASDHKLPGFQTQPASSARPAVELVASPPFLTPRDIRPGVEALVELINQAKTSVRVQLLTYSPVAGQDRYWPVLDQALRAAAVRGVKVRLLVSDWALGTRATAHLKSLALIPNLEVKVASIPEAKAGHIPYARVIHSKYLVVDGVHLALGTSNWEENYFLDSRNVEFLFRDSPLAAQATRIHERLWTSAYTFALDPGKTYERRKVD